MAKDRGPGVKLPPPLIYLFFMGCGVGVDYYWPLPVNWPDYTSWLALIMISLAIVLLVVTLYSFWRFRTHVEPWQPASYLISSGVFSFSRNPIYLGFILLVLGIGVWLENVWIGMSVVPATWVLYRWVILKEEAYLEQRFGQAYLDYKQRVRRWF